MGSSLKSENRDMIHHYTEMGFSNDIVMKALEMLGKLNSTHFKII